MAASKYRLSKSKKNGYAQYPKTIVEAVTWDEKKKPLAEVLEGKIDQPLDPAEVGKVPQVAQDGTVDWVVPLAGSTADSAMSGSSTNAPQNKVVKAYVDAVDGKVSELGHYAVDLHKYGSADITNGKYYYFNNPSVGNYAPVNSTALAGWGCIRVAVKKGQVAKIATLGGNNGRAYAVTDKTLKITAISPASYDSRSNPAVVSITEDGYLFVNCNQPNDDFSLEIFTDNSVLDIPGHIQEIDSLFYDETPIVGTFVSNGVIDSTGAFKQTTNTSYDIYEYSVTPGQKVRIRSQRSPVEYSGYIFAYAYDDSTPVSAIIGATNIVCEIDYDVPEGVDRICVFCNNSFAQSVNILSGEDVPEEIKDLKQKLIVTDGAVKKYTTADMYSVAGNKAYYYVLALSVGDIAPTDPIKFADSGTVWGCLKFVVHKGDRLSIETVGGNNGRAYAITDLNRKIIVVAAAGTNTIGNPFEYVVTEDGYCYVNSNSNTDANFSVIDVTTIGGLAARVEQLENEEKELIAPKISNPPIDVKKAQLRILDIGNSFSVDSTAYLSGLAAAAGLDTSDMCLYLCERGGGSFKTFYDSWHNQDVNGGVTGCHYGVSKLQGGLTQPISGDTNLERMQSCFTDCQWDMIIIHQVSTYSGDFDLWEGSTDAGYLTEMLRLIRLYQPQATIGYLMAHASFSQSNGDTQSLFAKISQSVKKMHQHFGIDFIIPTAAAIENLRDSQTLRTMYPDVSHGYSRDGHHLGYGLAQYVASATYFQCVYGKRYGVTIYGNTYRVAVSETSTYPDESIDVTNANATLAQICALLAYGQMYSINSPDNIAGTL